ncbi:MAG TPA: hypothetical protein PKN95_05460 [Verrucomicrobiota bacterium]|nr:hypothetical protein [Verrucomicrobiota bacterium]HNT13535.1 hypothetical protein [Verrucomicrobiota bacterium]
MNKHDQADQETARIPADTSPPGEGTTGGESPSAHRPWYRNAELLYGGATVLGVLAVFFWVVGRLNNNPLPVDARPLTPPVAPPPAVAPPPSIIEHPDEPDTNSYPVMAVAVPGPQFKLQGIFYHPQNPSVILDGRTVFPGDRVAGGFRVGIITSTNVTLVSPTATNVLSLSGR